MRIPEDILNEDRGPKLLETKEFAPGISYGFQSKMKIYRPLKTVTGNDEARQGLAA